MAESIAVRCLEPRLDKRAVALRLGLCASRVRAVYVPYFWFRATGSAPTPFGRRPIEVDCLVNALSGEGSTCGSFPLGERALPADAVLRSTCGESAAKGEAQRCVTHNVGRGLRTIADFRVALDARGIVYKPFWLLQDVDTPMIVDAMTGGWHPLAAARP